MQPYVRKYNYISDYYSTVFEFYSKHYQAYPINYYSIDWDESKDKIDKEQLVAGSYEKDGVGLLSGFKWMKIQQLPVYGVDAVQPVYTANEKGVTLEESMMTNILMPNYGIRPQEHDFVHFSQEFMQRGIDMAPLFVIKNVELATWGDINLYRLSLKVSSKKVQDVEHQISQYLMFLEFTKRIHTVETASVLLNLEERSDALSFSLDRSKSPTGLYVHKETV